MKRFTFIIIASLIAIVSSAEKHRILISTDIGGTDPDDNQSMTHLLMYADEFDIEGLISSPSYGTGSKDEILRMIGLYEKDMPKLQKGLKSIGSNNEYPTPDYLRSITKQGKQDEAPLGGFSESTEGSDWIIQCARKEDARPLWVLVWGALEDLAQALHDAPDIADKIRVYWIGGPNKKWGCNAYNYLINTFPDLWFIENNATYRGFIGSSKDFSTYQAPFWDNFMKGAGYLGNDFKNYYDGIVKMGDTPSLLYLMNASDAEQPEKEHWGGSFEKLKLSPKYIVTGPMAETDTIPIYGLMEWRLKGPKIEVAPDSVCFTMTVDRQTWRGYYERDGNYVVRYAPKAPATLKYVISSNIPGFNNHEGTFTVAYKWPAINEFKLTTGNVVAMPTALGNNWYTDIQEYPDKFSDSNEFPTPRKNVAPAKNMWQGTSTIARHRDTILKDWAIRFNWLKIND